MGRKEEALTVLREAAIYNGTPLDNTIMLSNEPTTNQSLQKSPFSILLHRNSVVLTMSVWLHWFFYGFCYYAVILFSMRVFAHQDDPQSEAALTQTHTCSFQYGELFVGSLSEALGVFFCTLVIERFGRLPALRWSYGLCSLFAFLLGGLMPIIPSSLISFLSYLARCSILCGVSSTWLATPEFFPTSTRVTAHAVASGVSRIGSFIAPFITQSSATTQEVALILGLACLTVVLTTAHLPETKGMALEECHGPRDGMKMKKPQRILSLLQRNRYQPLDETDSLKASPAIATGNGSSPDAMCSNEEDEETEIVIRL
jgi:MFS family permease